MYKRYPHTFNLLCRNSPLEQVPFSFTQDHSKLTKDTWGYLVKI